MAKWDIQKLNRLFLKSEDGKRLIIIGAHCFRQPLEGGLSDNLRKKQGEWRPLGERYLRSKEAKGQSPLKWVATGRTLNAMNSGMPAFRSPSTRKRMKFVVGTSDLLAYIEPQTFKGASARQKKDGFYATEARRHLFKWEDMDRSRIEQYIADGVEAAFSSAAKETK